MRYIIHPGLVKSKNDGDMHFIGARQLMLLYGVKPSKCIVHDQERMHGYWPTDNDIHLYPRRDSDYRLPEVRK